MEVPVKPMNEVFGKASWNQGTILPHSEGPVNEMKTAQ